MRGVSHKERNGSRKMLNHVRLIILDGGEGGVILVEEKSRTFSDNCFGSHLSSDSRAEQRSWRVETFVLVTCEEDLFLSNCMSSNVWNVCNLLIFLL